MPKLIFISLCVLLICLLGGSVQAQNTKDEVKVSFQYRQVPLGKVLEDLSKRYSINFSFSNSQIPVQVPLSCQAKELPLQKALKTLCACAGLTYQMIGDQVVLKQDQDSPKKVPLKAYTQNLRGKLIDAGLQTPLIGATVVLASTDPPQTTSTAGDGTFIFEKIPIGRHTLKASYLGYKETEASNVMVVSGKETMVSLALEEGMVQEAEVLVVAERDKALPQNLLISSSVHTLRTEEINRFAGSRQDPSRMASNYAGVSSASDQRNDLIVRGNSPLGVLWRLEGVEIPNPNHFTFTPNTGGAFSLLNNNLLANSDFLTGAFPAEYGNRIGAVMDVRMREGNHKKIENTLQLGLNGLEMVTEGPLVKKWSGSFLGSIRLFTFRPLEKIGIDIGYDGFPRYQDAAFKVVLPTPKAGKFVAWGIAGSSNVTIFDIDPDTTTWGKVRFRLEPTLNNQMYAFGMHHTYTLSPKTVTEAIVSASGSQVEVNTDARERAGINRLFYYLRNYERQVISKINVTHKPTHRLLFKGGLTWQKMYFNNQEIMYKDPVYEKTLDAQGTASLWQGYILSKYSLSPKVELQAGLYAQRFSIGSRLAIEPRVSIDYFMADAHRLFVSAGFQSQTQPLVYYEYRFFSRESPDFNQPYNKLDFTRSKQLVVGYDYRISPDLRFKAESYFQYHQKVPVSKRAGEEAFSMLNIGTDYSFVTVDSVVSKGKGKNYGLEFTLERFPKNGYYALGNVTLLKSRFTGGDGKDRPTTFNVGFISNLLIGKEFKIGSDEKQHLSVDLKINYTGGRRIIPIDETRTINEPTDKIYYDIKNAYLRRLKNYFRTDLRLSYQLNTQKTTHWIYAAADNIFNRKNELYYGWDLEENRAKKYYQLGIYPYLGYRIQF